MGLYELQQRLQELYRQLNSDVVSRENVRILIDEIIPLAGFSSGCLYLHDPESEELIPRLAVGKVFPGMFTTIAQNGSPGFVPVRGAFQSVAPILVKRVPTRRGIKDCIAGVVGPKEQAGVLYLELEKSGANEFEDSQALLRFLAIQKAVMDCFALD